MKKKMNMLMTCLSYCKVEFDEIMSEKGIMNKIIHVVKNVLVSYSYIPYSYKHNIAYKKVEKYLLYPNGALDFEHDWDKIIMYALFPWLGAKCINLIHNFIQSHHPTYWTYDNNQWTKHYKDVDDVDWFQAVIDWECARFTKPDKPLDAYDTFKKYYDESMYRYRIMNVLKACGLIDENGNKTDIMKNFSLN